MMSSGIRDPSRAVTCASRPPAGMGGSGGRRRLRRPRLRAGPPLRRPRDALRRPGRRRRRDNAAGCGGRRDDATGRGGRRNYAAGQGGRGRRGWYDAAGRRRRRRRVSDAAAAPARHVSRAWGRAWRGLGRARSGVPDRVADPQLCC
jgi:hypothetical protein